MFYKMIIDQWCSNLKRLIVFIMGTLDIMGGWPKDSKRHIEF